MLTDGQTDVGHINLMNGLVTQLSHIDTPGFKT